MNLSNNYDGESRFREEDYYRGSRNFSMSAAHRVPGDLRYQTRGFDNGGENDDNYYGRRMKSTRRCLSVEHGYGMRHHDSYLDYQDGAEIFMNEGDNNDELHYRGHSVSCEEFRNKMGGLSAARDMVNDGFELEDSRPVIRGYNTRYPHEGDHRRLMSGGLPDTEGEEEVDHALFIADTDQHRVSKKLGNGGEKPRAMVAPTRDFTFDDATRQGHEQPLQFKRAYSKKRASTEMTHDDSDEESPQQYRESRHSGAIMPWGVQAQPTLVPTELVSNATLKKRNLPRTRNAKIAKRATGATDPENITIVNMYDRDRKTWEEIADYLNSQRTATGRVPSLTPNGIILRYNRTAPTLYRSLGQEFIPLKLRKKGALPGEAYQLKDHLLVKWDEQRDEALVKTAQEYDRQKWDTVAEEMMNRFPDDKYTASGVATRYNAL